MMVMLCLVTTGIPCVGEQHFKKPASFHDDIQPRKFAYGSFVDCVSNPEIFVVRNGADVYPAYVIHFSE